MSNYGDFELSDGQVVTRQDIIDSIILRWVDAGLEPGDTDGAREQLESQSTDALIRVLLQAVLNSITPGTVEPALSLPANIQN